ncbi:MAG: hypothetical protein LUC47_11105 [Clostridiales bacterium]|nr:hypothetical protein [Clostridiales bacterium]
MKPGKQPPLFGKLSGKTGQLVDDGLRDGSSKSAGFIAAAKPAQKFTKQKEKHLKRIVSSAFCWSC